MAGWNSSTTGCLPCCVGRWCVREAGNCWNVPAWEANWTNDCFLTFAWHGTGDERLVATVNYAPNQSQCYVRLPFTDLGGTQWRFEDVIGDAIYERDGDDLAARGLYLDEPPWQAHAFIVTKSDLVPP